MMLAVHKVSVSCCSVQIETHSSDLLREQEYQAFDRKFGAAMSAIHDAHGKFILIRVSLPDSEENSTLYG